ncbi:hypothetical protein SODALDRAFT_272600 [Sodiomyces alkalinus F11]|uniref:VTC domain-containing protein n=1 Tax=Sodiomyces alkalinus (strain CBS 110278 / VKM F-3762 / F11) TaxID=1314773 RepID=A0A3N2Q0I4_SODAK|nr:hypothetical protein SODALDRAFT_272600 [Sodiomyces alkalinus F11]ROT40279.1 hypothetical protein SODALDRAFT_272600 [Sodiomyces alkalinus F11]
MADRDDREKKGFWGSLLRHTSLARKSPKPAKNFRRTGDGPSPPRRARFSSPDNDVLSPGTGAGGGRRPRRPANKDGGRDKHLYRNDGRHHNANGNGDAPQRPPLTSWPPSNMSSQEVLTLGQAMDLISSGVPAHKGHKRAIPHAPDHYYALYTTSAGTPGDESDAVNLHDSMTQFMTMRIQGSGSGRSSDMATYPWDTLEQPSYAFYFGRTPGTVTLNQWASCASRIPPTIALRDSGAVPRDVDLPRIFERLKELESAHAIEDESEERMYRSLYKRFLRDPDRAAGNPHRTLDRQITDLILVLSRPGYWVDFSDLRNQVATRFLFDRGREAAERYLRFCHQLLLSLELEIRIQARAHGEAAKEKLLNQLPPTIRWDLALAKRWRQNIRVERWGRMPEDVRLRYKLRKRQMRMLKRFAQVMKWPNLEQLVDAMNEHDAEDTLDLVSSDAFAFFSGLILPGTTFPFLIMNTLIDLDPDEATDALALMTHLNPNSGFQHRSYTYWSASCIVGKVLAPTCHALAGWIGPARPSPDLGRSQIVRVRCRRATKQLLTPEDVTSMSERSDPLGPPSENFPVQEYKLVEPKHADSLLADGVRIEVLSFKPSAGSGGQERNVGGDAIRVNEPQWYEASVQFAIDGVSWPLRLAYDVSFISAWPCKGGPHPLFFDYVFETIRADNIVAVRNWGGLYYGGSRRASVQAPESATGRGGGSASGTGVSGHDAENEPEKVLVVEAFGVPDHDVLARAWCSHWGLSAVVADVSKTCMGCAIREAYAATLTVVILIDSSAGKGTSE